MIGVTTSYFSYLETGKIKKINPRLINTIAKVLNISCIDLYMELGYLDRSHEIKMGSLVGGTITKINKNSLDFKSGIKEGFELARLKFAEKVLSLNLKL